MATMQERIRKLRVDAHLTQQELGSVLGVAKIQFLNMKLGEMLQTTISKLPWQTILTFPWTT